MNRVLSPLAQLRDEGTSTVSAHELLVVGKSKTFQTLLMEERARVKREVFTTGESPSVFSPSAVTHEERASSPLAPPDLGLPPSPPKIVSRGTDVETQATPATRSVGCMTGLTMAMLVTRDEIIEAQGETLRKLQEEEQRLQAVYTGESDGLLGMIGKMEREWLTDSAQMREEESRSLCVFDATSVINQRQFLREQRTVDRRTRRRTQRYHVVQNRIEDVRDVCLNHGIDTGSPDGTPRRQM